MFYGSGTLRRFPPIKHVGVGCDKNRQNYARDSAPRNFNNQYYGEYKMMQQLSSMQVHLDDARRQVRELSIEKRELIKQLEVQSAVCYGLEAAIDRTKLAYRIVVVILLGLVVWIGLSNTEYASKNNELIEKVKECEQSDLPQRFENVMEALKSVNKRNLELNTANEKLQEECSPPELIKAIKATPLPAIEKVG